MYIYFISVHLPIRKKPRSLANRLLENLVIVLWVIGAAIEDEGDLEIFGEGDRTLRNFSDWIFAQLGWWLRGRCGIFTGIAMAKILKLERQ